MAPVLSPRLCPCPCTRSPHPPNTLGSLSPEAPTLTQRFSHARVLPGRQFFRSGKVLPVDRGRGIAQPVMQVVAARAARGEWVHLFPEGRVGYSGTLAPCKWGVGKVICDAAAASDRQACPLRLRCPGWGRSGMARCLRGVSSGVQPGQAAEAGQVAEPGRGPLRWQC